jgi:phosphatidate cytidylyltransferase
MLRQRVITALILAPSVIAAVLLLPNEYLAVIAGLVVAVGALEWGRLSGLDMLLPQILYAVIMLICMATLYKLLPAAWVPPLITLSLVWWLFALWRLARYHSSRQRPVRLPLRAVEGYIVLLPAWLAVVSIHRIPESGPYLLLFVLMMIWSADVGAYFAGHRWGKHKLAPQVSPGKTREGVYGALAGALICALILAAWIGSGAGQYLQIILLCLVTVCASIVGDLFESLVKRQRGVKDSGSLLPGHGGMLDRIDSITAAAPVFLFGLSLLGEVR